MSLTDIGDVPEDQIIELKDELSDYLWTLIGDFEETYSPFAHRYRYRVQGCGRVRVRSPSGESMGGR